jgi:hypothetical protein
VSPKLTGARPADAARRKPTSRVGDATVGGLDDTIVENLVHQWQPELMYCYTQYGLREHSALAGRVTMRVALSPNGSVGHSVVGVRDWRGAGGAEVESCLRARIAAWRFPPADAGSIHEFTLEFGR